MRAAARALRPSVHDGLLAPALVQQLADALAWVPLYLRRPAAGDASVPASDGYAFYPLATVEDKRRDDAAPVLDGLDDSLAPVRAAWQAVRQAAGPVRLYECEYTANAFGSEGHAHHDCLAPERRPLHVTAILYCNTGWQLDWAGETVVFDGQGDIAAAVLPRPGRITILRGDPLHAARGVARACPVARRVLVFKMWHATP